MYRKGRFCNNNSKSEYYPRGYPYVDNSDREFSDSTNCFVWTTWSIYLPFDIYASTQMIIKKVIEG